MFGRVKSCFVLSVALLAISCVQDKKNNFSDTEDASGLLSAAALRVAIYYVGDVKCRAHLEAQEQEYDEQYIEKVLLANNNAKYLEAGKNTHRLDGDRAELSSKEYIAKNKDKQANPPLGGDEFLQANGIARTIAALEDNCRRVLLSVDSEVLPSLSSQNLYHTSGNFEEGTDAADNFWPARFAADFGDFGGKITCASDQLNSLCSYAQIKDGKRYFAYLYPKQGEDSLAAEVTYTRDGEELTETITIADIALNELQLPTTQLSAIKVVADCGEDDSCLFVEHGPINYKLECGVEGENCGNGFAFAVEKIACDGDTALCSPATATPTTRDKLCTGAATVAALSEDEINLSCKFSSRLYDKIIVSKKDNIRLSEQRLAGKLCAVTTSASDKTKDIQINASECERDADGKLQQYRLELSFALEE